ncbi:flippase [Cetobacterium somerae]|uniref:flippase n=1 Tax=Cetobacterium somerae TaxID=188913 RepID=UPI001F05D8FB|nr:flippase [Cetobacterium somerae]UPO97413.1 flippase [Cetobacterium somerae]
MSNLKKNFIYTSIYNLINIIVPFILLPYIARVLGKENLGINSYTNSITQYFLLMSMLGINLYGTREISYIKDDKKKLNITIIDLYLVKIFSTLFAFIFFLIFIRYQPVNLKNYLYIYSLSFLTNLLDITWFFQGIEDFKKISIRNIIFKLLTLILILIFVRHKNDLNKYIYITILGNIFGQVTMYTYILEKVDFSIYEINLKRLVYHLKRNLKLFILQIAVQIYLYLDKVMLGYYGQYIQAGYYDIAQQIVRLGLVISGTLSTVMLPKISSLVSNKRYDEIKLNIGNALEFVITISFPLIFGLLSINQEFIKWFFGSEYLGVSSIISILSVILLIIPIGNVLGIQLMIPLGKEMLVSISPIAGAITNLILNMYLIPKYSGIGAAIATLFSELIGTGLTCFFMRKWFNMFSIMGKTKKSLLASITMYIALKYLNIKIELIPLLLFIKIFIGIAIYVSLMFILKDKNIIRIVEMRRKK